MLRSSRRFACALILVLSCLAVASCGDDDGNRTQAVSVDVSADPIVISTGAARVEVSRADARMAIFDVEGRLLTRGTGGDGLYFERGDAGGHALSVTEAHAEEDGALLILATTNGAAQLHLEFASARTLV